MFYSDMRNYDYYLYQNNDGYGQPTITEGVQGSIKMAIYTVSQTLQQNVLYSNCSYVGLTNDTEIDDKYVILYEGKRLKVLYIQPRGRFIQVFLSRM